jgi:hypothetical protein
MVVRFFMLMALFGMLYPTSSGGIIFPGIIESVPVITLTIIFIYFIIFNSGLIDFRTFFFSLLTPLIIVGVTPFTPFSYIAYGALCNYISITLLAGLRLTYLKNKLSNFEVSLWVSMLILVPTIFGLLQFIDFPGIRSFSIDHYTWGWDDILEFMFLRDKPVSFFASHSLASFMFYTFSMISFGYYNATRSPWWLFLFFVTLSCLLLNKCTSSIFLLAILLYYVVIIIMSMPYVRRILILSFIFINAVVVIQLYGSEWVSQIVDAITNSSDSGINGRYSNGTKLFLTIQYIINNPLHPVGLGYSDYYLYTDSGYVVHAFRAGIIGMVIYYISAFKIFQPIWTSFLGKIYFISILLFEIGYPGLYYHRLILFVPACIIIMMDIERRRVDPKQKIAPATLIAISPKQNAE